VRVCVLVRFCSCLSAFCCSFFPLHLFPAIAVFILRFCSSWLLVSSLASFSFFLSFSSSFSFHFLLPPSFVLFLFSFVVFACHFCSLPLYVWFLPIFVFLCVSFRSLLPPLLFPLRPLLILRFSSIFLFLFGLCSLIVSCLFTLAFSLLCFVFYVYSSSCLRFRFCFLVFFCFFVLFSSDVVDCVLLFVLSSLGCSCVSLFFSLLVCLLVCVCVCVVIE